MKLILLFGVVVKFIVPIAGEIYPKNIAKCLFISENLNISEVMPIKYDVYIIVKPRQRILSGYISIIIEVMKPIRNMMLHAKSAFSYKIEDKLDRSSYIPFDFKFCEKEEILIMQFSETVGKGKYRFVIGYRSIFNKNFEKIFYPSTWTNKNENWMLTNLYTPNAIRALFPCWDDPRIKATYNITIQTPIDYVVLSSNRPEESSFYIHHPLVTRKFARRWMSNKRYFSAPTHLIAFLIINDITRDAGSRDMHYIWHKTDADKKFTYVLEKAEMVTSFFSKFMKLNSSHLPSQIHHVVLPNSPMKSMGAPGLVIYRERYITFDKISDPPGRLLDVITLVTYEMARQLFVGVINPQLESDYVWLNEIFASFCGYYIMDKIWKSDRLMELFVVKIIQPTLNIDTLIEREPIISKAKNSDGIDGLLYPLLYHKKAFALIRMLLQLYNPNVFNEAITKYVHERKKDMWTVLEEVHSLKFESDYTVKEIMNTWLTAKYHPELFIQRDYNKWTAACISSRKFLESNPKWIIPVNYITESNYDSYNISEVLWLKWNEVKNITAINSDDFLIVNAEQMGYYHVNYDDKNWILISTYMQKNNISNIPPLIRAQLVNDAYYFTTRRQLKGSIFVEITKHLKQDTDFIAWYPMFNILSDMSSYFKFSESNHTKEYFLGLIDGVLNKIGFEDFVEDDKMRKLFRYLIRKWACKLGHSVCRKTTLDRLMIYINYYDELERIPEMLKEWIICDGLKTEDLNIWERILNKAIDYNNTVLLEYLSCTENSTIIVHYLTLMLRTHYFSKTEQFMGPICRKIVKNHIWKNTVLRFVIEYYSEIVRRFPDQFPSGTLLSDMIMNVYSLKDLDMVRELGDRLFSPSAEGFSIFLHLLESVNLLISHRKRYLTKVQDKFQEFHNLTANV